MVNGFFIRFLHYKVTFFPTFRTLLFGRKFLCAAHVEGRGSLCSHYLKAECLDKLFGLFLYRRFVYSVPFISLFNHSFMSPRTQGYLFSFGLYSNTTLFSCTVSSLAIGSSFSCFLDSFDITPSLCVISHFVLHDNMLQDHLVNFLLQS